MVRERRRISSARSARRTPPRILLASQPGDGGVARHVADLAAALPDAGFLVDLACAPGSLPWLELEGRPGIVLHALGAGRRPGPRDAAALSTLARLAGRSDVIHVHSSKAGFLGRLAAVARGKRRTCLFTPHGWSFWAASGAERRFYLQLERIAAHWCRTIVAVSRAERDAGLRAGVGSAGQYRIVRNGIDLERFDRVAEAEAVPGRIVMVGRLAPPKRPDLVVRALAGVRRRIPGAEVVLVGAGPLAAETHALAASLGIADAVSLLGDRDDVPALLATAGCVTLASDYEACPLSLIEAMAVGVPVVATSFDGAAELIDDGETGIVVAHDDADALAAALVRVLTDRDSARRLAAQARDAARRQHSLGQMVAATVSLYEEAIRP